MIWHAKIKEAFIKSCIVAILFIVAYQFYNIDLIREEVEDIAFDIVDKFYIKDNPVDTKSPNIMVFAFDDIYMVNNGLYDEHNNSNYGYLFPRDKIADFILRLDDLVSKISIKNRPKALFIDYDMSFTSMPYGKILSNEDKKLINVLKKARPYKIFLPKTEIYNFIENSPDPQLQNAIKKGQIVFVSVPLLLSEDGVVRRYKREMAFNENNRTKKYLNVNLALWKTIRGDSKKVEIEDRFLEDDIVGNRIWIKGYRSRSIENGCSEERSYWEKLTKYSANCSLSDLIEEDFSNAIIMLGGTHSKNDDKFQILNFIESEKYAGIDLHANTLMTMLYLDGSLKRLPLLESVFIVFIVFFTLSLFIGYLFNRYGIENEEIEFIILLIINSIVLVAISIYLLYKYKVWFNWFVPLILYELVEVYEFFEDLTPGIIEKIKRRML